MRFIRRAALFEGVCDDDPDCCGSDAIPACSLDSPSDVNLSGIRMDIGKPSRNYLSTIGYAWCKRRKEDSICPC